MVQSDLFAELPSVIICPLTTTVRTDADQSGSTLSRRRKTDCASDHSRDDKITVVPAAKIGGAIGMAEEGLLLRVNRALALFLGIV